MHKTLTKIQQGVLPEGLDEVLNQIIDEQARLHQLELDRAAAEEEVARSPSPESFKVDDILATLTPEELAAARRQALLRQYAYVDSPDDAPANSPFDGEGRPEGAPPKGGKAAENEEKRKAEERRRLIEEALRKDSRKKKHRKNDEGKLPLSPIVYQALVIS